MKKWLKMALGGGVLLVISFFAFRTWTKSFSPEAEASISEKDFKAHVFYCRPSRKGRVIFGGLVPYGKVWRTGANEATVIRLEQDTYIAGSLLEKGSYSLWTIPDPKEWTVIFNRETGQWGTQYDPEEDVLKVKIAPQYQADTVEMFTISLKPNKGEYFLVLEWENTRVAVPMKKAAN